MKKEISKVFRKFIHNPTVQEYIDNGRWEDLWYFARYNETDSLNFEDIVGLYDIIIGSGVPCLEPPEAQMLHKYLGINGILNENVAFRANDGDNESYKDLIPYIGKEVQVLQLDSGGSELFDEHEDVDLNFSWCFWKISISGYKNSVVCGDCIDFPQFKIKQVRL